MPRPSLKSPFPNINRRQRPPPNARPLNKSFKLMHLNALAFIATYSLILTNIQGLHSSSLYELDASISHIFLAWLETFGDAVYSSKLNPMISLCSRKRGSTHYSATTSTAVNQHCAKVPIRQIVLKLKKGEESKKGQMWL